MATRRLLPIAAGLVAVSLMACSEGSPTAPEPQPLVSVSLGLSADSIRPEEGLGIGIEVTNVGAQSVTLSFPDACQFNYVIRQGGEVVWSHEARMLCAAQLTSLTLPPGGSWRYPVVTWDQSRIDGRPSGPGSYEVVGELRTSDRRPQSAPVAFVIRP